jgi:hypothetical protein
MRPWQLCARARRGHAPSASAGTLVVTSHSASQAAALVAVALATNVVLATTTTCDVAFAHATVFAIASGTALIALNLGAATRTAA